MGLYAFFLAGSNFFAPVICGFIAQYQGWRWVFYWPSLFVGCAIIFLFFFMEETNYIRDQIEDSIAANVRVSSSNDSEPSGTDPEKDTQTSDQRVPMPSSAATTKPYWKRLSLLGPRQKQNTMFRRFWQMLYYLSWPVVFYAGYISFSFLSVFIFVLLLTSSGSRTVRI